MRRAGEESEGYEGGELDVIGWCAGVHVPDSNQNNLNVMRHCKRTILARLITFATVLVSV